MEDSRYLALKRGLQQLTTEQLQKILDTDAIACDTYWYDPIRDLW
jgi:hypothetical protein